MSTDEQRMDWLCELIRSDPDRPLRQLQREVLHTYPIESNQLRKRWMSGKTGQAAIDRIFREEDGAPTEWRSQRVHRN